MRSFLLVIVALIAFVLWSVGPLGSFPVHTTAVGPERAKPGEAPFAPRLANESKAVPAVGRTDGRVAIPLASRTIAKPPLPATMKRPPSADFVERASNRVEVRGTIVFPLGTVVPEGYLASVSLSEDVVADDSPWTFKTDHRWVERPGGSADVRPAGPAMFEWGPIDVLPGDFVLRVVSSGADLIHERGVTVGSMGGVLDLRLRGMTELSIEIVDELTGERPSLVLVRLTAASGFPSPLGTAFLHTAENMVILGKDGPPFGYPNPAALPGVPGDYVLEAVPAGPYTPIAHRFRLGEQGADLRIAVERMPTARIWLQDALGQPSPVDRRLLDQLVIESLFESVGEFTADSTGEREPQLASAASDADSAADRASLIRVRGYDLSSSSAPKQPRSAAWQEPLHYVPGKGLTAPRWFRQKHEMRPWRPELNHVLELSFREPGRYLVSPPPETQGPTFEPLVVEVGPEPTDWITSTKPGIESR